jgi:thiol-disulfide isomerase/thioredoxin
MSSKSKIAVAFSFFLLFTATYAKHAPNLDFKDLEGHSQKLDSTRGSITVISFWATWCVPCREELPRFSALNQEYASKGVRFLAISVDETKDRNKIQPFLQKQNISLDVWVGGNIDVLNRLGLGNVVPGTLILDKDGEIMGRIMGEAQDVDIRTRLDWLLHDRQGTAPELLTKRY